MAGQGSDCFALRPENEVETRVERSKLKLQDLQVQGIPFPPQVLMQGFVDRRRRVIQSIRGAPSTPNAPNSLRTPFRGGAKIHFPLEAICLVKRILGIQAP